MAKKRSSTKQHRRQRRRQAKERRQDRREERLTQVLASPEGEKKFERFNELWATFHMNPRPTVYPELVELVSQLNLLKLSETRYGTAALLATLYRQYPEKQKEWDDLAPEFKNSVILMYPGDGRVDSVERLDQELMAWAIDQDQGHVDRVRVVAFDADSIFQTAAIEVLEHYAEIFPHLETGLDLTLEDLWGQRTDAVNEFEQFLKEETPNGCQVLGVRWDRDKYVIHTLVEGPVDGLPVVWNDTPVLQQQASQEERFLYLQYQQDQEIV